MIGCAFPDVQVAVQLGPIIVVPLMIFAGLLANTEYLSPVSSWIQYISPFKYSYEGFAINEYTDLDI